ncbi:DNA topoisomerase I, mitochondrial isoform X1 [Salvelinus fontinalis]|uniref:DNA topoisomerase I, mitochondrial isoform X1 n=1 Tax=Salvelinus fontinalis TaxID=8038 RepID=UPI0024860C0C|nr:DNA topoisomerase I, mitochondrial isoform X1 [Salvelinus fontinalis]
MKLEGNEGHGGAKTSSRKRTASESKRDESPTDRKRSKDGERDKKEETELKHKAKHSSSKHPRKPLQEPKITSSGGLKAVSENNHADVKTKGVAMDASLPSEKNTIDLNNNISAKHTESDERKVIKTEIREVDLFAPIEHSDMESSDKKSKKTGHSQKDNKHKHKSKSGKKGHHGTDEKNPEQRKVGEISANSSDVNSKKRKSKDSCETNVLPTGDSKKETAVKKENTKKEREKKDRRGKDTKTTGKKKPEGKEESKKKKKDGDDGKSKKGGKKEGEDSTWKWWEEGNSNNGIKWTTLEHKGPLFPPEYEPLPNNVSFFYNGNPIKLSLPAEEVATFYAKMLDHEYTTKSSFQENFFTDWREEMTVEEREQIKKLSKCDFTHINKYFLDKSEEKKAMTKEQKQVLKEENNKLTEEYGFCELDGHREKIGNFRVEPPGLFRGRGEHPKMGKMKKRIQPEEITINCSKGSNIPVAPKGHRWRKVQHDNTVTWLASWVENVQGNFKYVMLNPSSKLKGEKDWQKYEVARKLKLKVETIRRLYREDWKNREMKTRQRGVALYFIDKLALRAGNEKEESETADTVGCCSLRVEHITLHQEKGGQEFMVEFDFLGKDSIRYYNEVPVEGRVFKNLKLFMENKEPEDDLFDRINTTYLNKYLNQSMPGLSAKVFRTFNASTTLQEQLNKLTTADMSLEEKLLSYNRANRAVAILCNHQRAAPKTFEKSMQNLQDKIAQKQQQLDVAKKELKEAQKEHKKGGTERTRKLVEKTESVVKRLEEQLKKLQLQMTDREENKIIALGTSKLNYLDPRISVAWCRKFNVPIEKIYNKTQRDKFAWAIDMTEEDFQF